MQISRELRNIAFDAGMVPSPLSNAAGASKAPLITGEHWARSTGQEKQVYLLRLANVVRIEAAYCAVSPASGSLVVAPQMIEWLEGNTLDGVRDALDAWCRTNPDQKQRAVIEILWFELVVAGRREARSRT